MSIGKIFTTHKRIYYDYNILETLNAGIVLTGPEVKSVKNGQCKLDGSYAILKMTNLKNKYNTELFLLNAYISLYKPAGESKNYDPQRSRKLLLNKKEIKNLSNKLINKRLTLIPIKMYNMHNRVKVEIAVCQMKKKIDKRQLIKKREINRKIQTNLLQSHKIRG